jgi:hypothetical protein
MANLNRTEQIALRTALMRKIAMDHNRMNREAALRVAEAGMSVFPLRPQNMAGRWNLSPVYPSGARTATRSAERIVNWWDQHTTAIPATPCTNIVVIDANDTFPGIDGVAVFEALIADKPWPSPPIVLTPNGKQYYFLQPDPPLDYHTGDLPEGIDVRGMGGYVVAPGAILPDGSGWRVDPNLPPALIPKIPAWLERIIRSPGA